MDNKLTKKRLSDLLSYDWVLIIVFSIIIIMVWELIYSMGGVRLTTGQHFKYYYDQNISSATSVEFYQLLEKEETFSYDVLSHDLESLTSDFNVLSTRLSIQEGDVVITDSKDNSTEGNPQTVRAKTMIDSFSVYALDDLLKDAKKYLTTNFFKDGLPTENVDFSNLDQLDHGKIKSVFLERMKGDNRFRKEHEKEEGVLKEIKRIEKLMKEVSDFEKFLAYADTNPEVVYSYKKYQQVYDFEKEGTNAKKDYATLLEKQEVKAYGINVNALSGGKSNPSQFFKMKNAETAENVVVIAFNFLKYQPHLQFETISFFNTIIRECSNILG